MVLASIRLVASVQAAVLSLVIAPADWFHEGSETPEVPPVVHL
jgi:hypothetical protein